MLRGINARPLPHTEPHSGRAHMQCNSPWAVRSCCQPPELAEAVEKEVVVYGGYEKFPGLFLLPSDPRRSRIEKKRHHDFE